MLSPFCCVTFRHPCNAHFHSSTQDVINVLQNAVASTNAPRTSTAFFAVGGRLKAAKNTIKFMF